MTDIFLNLKNIQKKYIDASKNIQVLNGVNLSLSKNNIVSLIGPSGSGKSTLLHILGLLETVDKGEYFFNDVNLINLKDDQKTIYRRKSISKTSLAVLLSKLPVGSSAKISSGSFIKALAIATRCCSPPDNS